MLSFKGEGNMLVLEVNFPHKNISEVSNSLSDLEEQTGKTFGIIFLPWE